MEIDICQFLHERICRMEKMYLVDIDRETHKYNVIPYKGTQKINTEHDHDATPFLRDKHITLSDRQVHGDGVHSGVFEHSMITETPTRREQEDFIKEFKKATPTEQMQFMDTLLYRVDFTPDQLGKWKEKLEHSHPELKKLIEFLDEQQWWEKHSKIDDTKHLQNAIIRKKIVLQDFVDSSREEQLATLRRLGYNSENPLDDAWLLDLDVAKEMWELYNQAPKPPPAVDLVKRSPSDMSYGRAGQSWNGDMELFEKMTRSDQLKILSQMGYTPENPEKVRLWVQRKPLYKSMLDIYNQAAGAVAPEPAPEDPP